MAEGNSFVGAYLLLTAFALSLATGCVGYIDGDVRDDGSDEDSDQRDASDRDAESDPQQQGDDGAPDAGADDGPDEHDDGDRDGGDSHTLDLDWHAPSGLLTRYVDKIFAYEDIVHTARVTFAPGVPLTPDGDIDLYFELWQPPRSDPETHRPLVIWLHGGGWTAGSTGGPPVTDELYGKMPQYVQRGYVFASIAYRLNRGAVSAVADTLAAVRYFRAHSANHRIDPNRIILGGYSAGAISAQMAALASEKAEALAAAHGNDCWLSQPSWVTAAITYAGSLDFNPKVAAFTRDAADPLDTPLFLDIHGENDGLVGFDEAEAAMARLDLTIDFAEVAARPGKTHTSVWNELSDTEGDFATDIIPLLLERVIVGDQCPAASMGPRAQKISWD